jgi:hypothetical protein
MLRMDCVKGIVFMGTPHQGYFAGLETTLNLVNTALHLVGRETSPVLDSVRPNSEFLRHINHDFSALVMQHQTAILSVYETLSPGMGMGQVRLSSLMPYKLAF